MVVSGIEHSIRFVWCNCESLAVTLVRAQLWPATPHHPKRAFTFKLLDLAESLLLECQVALRDFCNALYFRSPYPVFQVCMHSVMNVKTLTIIMVIEKGHLF